MEAPDPTRSFASFWGALGLFAKPNPNATVRSVVRHGILGAIGGLLFWYAIQRWKWDWGAPLWTIVPTCLFGVAIAAILEWQIDDSDDEHDERLP